MHARDLHWNWTGIILILSMALAGCETPQPAKNTSPSFPFATQPVNKQARDVVGETNFTEEALRKRIIDTYASFWPLISIEDQHEGLPALLEDPLPEVRAFGIERIAVLLRDGEANESELQLLVNRLQDDSSQVRLAAAKLLPEIDVAGLAEYVANALSTEVDLDIATEELRFFQTHPNGVAFSVVLEKIQTGPVEPAAKALVSLLNESNIAESRSQQIVKTVQQVRKIHNIPELVTIEAMLGNAQDQNRLIPILNHGNQEMRIAVAKGFAAAGFSEPLIKIANQPVMYSFALEALKTQQDLQSFIKLIDLYQERNPQWNDAAISIMSSLDTRDLLRGDDILQRLRLNQLRLRILKSVWESASNRTMAEQKAIAKLAVPLMIEQSDAVGALQLLDTFGESLTDEEMIQLRFKAAIFASAWDAAADARPYPTPWIEAWIQIQEQDANAATVIKQQIQQRFSDQLTNAQRETLGINKTETPSDAQSNIIE